MMKFSTYLIFSALLILSSSAFAAKCYTPKEVEAEQGVRILSELMVIGLNCQHMTPKGQENLYNQYKRFALQHQKLFSGYEDTLLAYYRREGQSSPNTYLHKVRTDVANKISKDAAIMRPDTFCATYAPRISKARAMPEAKIRKWAQTVFPGHPVSQPVCKK
jgi:hypothetical protein